MLKTKILHYDNLPEDIKKRYPYGNYDCFLLVYHKDKLISVQCDGMEPEDTIFYRDLSWIPELIEEAYKLGLKDGNSLDYLE